jgi:hypothetical protein
MAQPKQRTAVTASVSSPIGGWNARDSIAEMPPLDAVVLNNMFPTPTDVQLRLGYTKASVLTTTTGVQTISSITVAGSIATLTTSAAHGLSSGNTISITGATPSGYNGIYTISVINSTSFTYNPIAVPDESATVVGVYTIQITTPINSLMNYAGPQTQDLFAAAGTQIYDVSGPVAIQTHTISNDKLQHVNISTAGGHFLVACNGQDPTTFWNGIQWINNAPTDVPQVMQTITHVGTLATVTTAEPHGLVSGNLITVSGVTPAAYNGNFKITVLDATQFTYTMASTPSTNATANGTAYSITSITNTGTGALVTTAADHNLYTGNIVVVTGATPSAYNGTYAITKYSDTQFTYALTTNPGGNATVVGAYTVTAQTISTLTHTGTTANVVTASPHGLFTGNQITVSGCTPSEYNGTFIITRLSDTQFSCIMGSSPATDATTIGSYVVVAQTISTNVQTGIIAKATTPVNHDLVTGDQVVITGCLPIAYNGTYNIIRISATEFSYIMASFPVTGATTVGTYSTQQGSYTINYAITGVNSNKFVHVNLFKNRLYFTEEGSMRVWYLPVDSIAGEAQQLDFGGIARNGGYIQGMATWTIDAGQGADDYAVFVTNMGEVIVYNGTDPNSADTWALKGVWQLGFVFARRCFYKFAGDILLLTQDGLVPLASALQSSRLDPRVNLTDKIYYAISQAASLYGNNFGWQINYYASQNMLIINVPINAGVQQFVMNTISKAWANFSNISSQCWELSNDQMYFGSAGFVGHFWNAYSDNGNNINAEIQQAYSYFDARGQLKRFTMIRPIFQTDNGIPGVLVGINVDFDTQNNLGTVSFNAQNAQIGSWDNAIWDESQWGGTLSITKSWQGVTGIGYSGGVAMKIASQGIDVHWASTDYVMERGGVL